MVRISLFLFVCAVLWAGMAEAITWHFDGQTTQGWAAKKDWGGFRNAFHLLPSVVADGVWTINASTAVEEVVSPTLGYDSRLFDRVRLRLRTLHHTATAGVLFVSWTNEHNRGSPGEDPEPLSKDRFRLSKDIVYTSDWQEVEISLAGHDPDEVVWEGLLWDIRLSFCSKGDGTYCSQEGGVEIDWITLTGVEEILQGELAPPQVDYFRFAGQGLFAPPLFYPIVSGLGDDFVGGGQEAGILTDLDGDDDLDLLAPWTTGGATGWAMALNDGHGAFQTARTEETEFELLSPRTGDVTGDGHDEIAIYLDRKIEVWSIGEEYQIEVLTQIPARYPLYLADWDGDGDSELFAAELLYIDSEERILEIWDVKDGVWHIAEVLTIPATHAPALLGDVTGDGALDVCWNPILNRATTRLVGRLGDEIDTGEVFAFDADDLRHMPSSSLVLDSSRRATLVEVKRLPPFLYAGDVDGDGQVDLLTARLLQFGEERKGLVWWKKQPSGGIEEQVLYDEGLFLRSPVVVRDLDADGIADWVFVGGDRASGFGVFVAYSGIESIPEAVEAHRLDSDGTEVLPGDVDGDGDLDLVVLSPLRGGVYVLKNTGSEQPTAVQTTHPQQRPVTHRLGDSYPNPFNPAVVIPLDLATDAVQVSLTVYDVLGRRVRQVWQGPLGVGSHRFTWDGRDAAGKDVAAGVYIYQVEVDGQVEAKKTTKLP